MFTNFRITAQKSVVTHVRKKCSEFCFIVFLNEYTKNIYY